MATSTIDRKDIYNNNNCNTREIEGGLNRLDLGDDDKGRSIDKNYSSCGRPVSEHPPTPNFDRFVDRAIKMMKNSGKTIKERDHRLIVEQLDRMELYTSDSSAKQTNNFETESKKHDKVELHNLSSFDDELPFEVDFSGLVMKELPRNRLTKSGENKMTAS